MPLNTRWSTEETTILETYYPKEGIAVKQRLPLRSTAAILSRAQLLGLHVPNNAAITWKDAELKILRDNYSSMRVSELANLLPGHTLGAIYKQAERMGLRRHTWTDEELKILRKHYATMPVTKLCDLLPKHKVGAIQAQAHRLGLQRA